MSTTEPIVQLRGVNFGYDQEAILREVNLAIRDRDFVAVIGPNGGGKTTLLKLMLGLLTPWQGQVTWRSGIARGAIGYVPQFSYFDKTFPVSVLDVVLMGRLGRCDFMRRYRHEDKRVAGALIEQLGLARYQHAPIGDLSGGQLQRVLIARALAAEPSILFMDEPTASVDAETRSLLNRLLRELNERIPIVVVTHDITSFAQLIKQFVCVNRNVFYHDQQELTPAMLHEAYGCPVELIAHGTPHRVLPPH